MPKYAKRDYQVGEFWLSKQSRSPAWCRTWFDAKTRQTRRASLSTTDFDEAKQRLTEWFIVNHNRKKDAPENVTLAEIFAPFYEKHASKLSSAYQSQLSLRYWLEFYGEATIADALDIARQETFHVWLMKDKAQSQNSASRVVGVGKTALNWAWKRGYLELVPYVQPIKRKASPPKGRALDLEDVKRLLASSQSQHITDFIWLMLATASRPDAILELTAGQCDIDRRLIYLNKEGREQTKKYRPTVKMPESIVPIIERLVSERNTDDLLITYRGRPTRSVKQAWRKLRSISELDDQVNPYSLRHTMARWLRAQGVPAWEVSAQLGHKQSDMSTTEIYAPFDPAYLSNSVAAIDQFLDGLRVNCV